MNENVIHCIGDSHASFFSGCSEMQPEWPRQAKNTIILLCFGEIDCRVHMIRQAEIQNLSMSEIARKCANRYFSVIKEVQRDFEVVVWNVIPSSPQDKINSAEFPPYGTSKERNKTTAIFNAVLNELLKAERIKVLSAFDDLLDEKGNTNQYYYGDDIHLSQRAMPLVVCKVKQLYPKNEFTLFHSCIINILPDAAQIRVFYLLSNLKADHKKIKEKIHTKIKHTKKVIKLIN